MKKLPQFLFLIGLLFSSFCIADIKDSDYAKCAAVKGDLARLDCFDRLAAVQELDKPKTELSGSVGKWQVKKEINPVDDTATVTLFLAADSPSVSRGEGVWLSAICSSNKTDFYINWGDYLGGRADVLYRVGTSKAVTERWLLSTDSKASFYDQPIRLLKEMLSSTKFLAQITPYNENPVTAVFDTTGLAEALKPLRKTCGW